MNSPDIITDFKTKIDKIDLSKIDANIETTKDDAFKAPKKGEDFKGSFTKAGELFFSTSNNTLYGNVDNDSEPDFAIELTGISSLTSINLKL